MKNDCIRAKRRYGVAPINELNGDSVSFHYKDYKTKDDKGLPIVKTLTLSALEFLRRFLLHVLPRGFQRIRYYGFLAIRNRKMKLKDLQKSLNFRPPPGLQIPWQQRLQQLTGTDPDACPFCLSKTMLFLGYVFRQPSNGRSPPALLQIIVPPKAGLLPNG